MGLDWTAIQSKRAFSALTLPLAVCSALYGLGLKLDNVLQRVRKRRTLPGFVLSVGNLSAGGTGKTPAVCMIAQWAVDQGHSVAILSRGYGGRNGKRPMVVSDGERVLATPDEAGDEPVLIARTLNKVPVVVARERQLAGQMAHREFGSDFYILDDGFQHRALNRDLDLVLMDFDDPIGNGHLLPWGPLREPVRNISRADALVFTRSREGGVVDERIKRWISRSGVLPCFRSIHVPKGLVIPARGEEEPPSFLRGKAVAAFCGIARPAAFRGTLEDLGAEVRIFRAFPDHYRFSKAEMDEFAAKGRSKRAELLVTTEKDWMRAEAHLSNDPFAAYLRIGFELLSGENGFFQMIRDRAEESSRNIQR